MLQLSEKFVSLLLSIWHSTSPRKYVQFAKYKALLPLSKCMKIRHVNWFEVPNSQKLVQANLQILGFNCHSASLSPLFLDTFSTVYFSKECTPLTQIPQV